MYVLTIVQLAAKMNAVSQVISFLKASREYNGMSWFYAWRKYSFDI